MGRHTSPEQGPFYRSIVLWLLPWLMIAAVVLVAVWIAVDAVGGNDDIDGAPVARRSPTKEASAVASSTPEKTTEATPTATPEPEETEEVDDGEKVALITKDISVQVLNGTSAPEADDRMADRLSSLGYEVVAIEASSKQYPETTVFWSFPEAQEAAEALAEKFGWVAQQKPENLSSTVDLHVVVGADEV